MKIDFTVNRIVGDVSLLETFNGLAGSTCSTKVHSVIRFLVFISSVLLNAVESEAREDSAGELDRKDNRAQKVAGGHR